MVVFNYIKSSVVKLMAFGLNRMNKHTNEIGLSDRILIFKYLLFGGIVFSPMSSFITMDVFHLPISLPEVLFILFLPFCRKEFHFNTLQRKQTWITVLAWLSLIAMAFIVGKYLPYAILSTARSYLYLILFYLLFCNENNISVNTVYYICIGAFSGWLIDAFISFKTYTLAGNGAAVSYGPMLCIPIIIGVQILKGKYKSLILMLLFSALLMVLSGMRRQMLITIVSFLVAFIYEAIRNKTNLIKISIGTLLISLIIALNFPFIEGTIKSYSGELYFRVITKTESFLQGEENEGDNIRRELIHKYIDNMGSYIIPQGFVSKQTATDHDTGNFNDLPMLEVSQTFSLWGALLFILYFIYTAYRCYILTKKGFYEETILIFPLSFVIILILLFLEGSFLTFPYAVPFTGYCLGNLHRYACVHFKIKQYYK